MLAIRYTISFTKRIFCGVLLTGTEPRMAQIYQPTG